MYHNIEKCLIIGRHICYNVLVHHYKVIVIKTRYDSLQTFGRTLTFGVKCPSPQRQITSLKLTIHNNNILHTSALLHYNSSGMASQALIFSVFIEYFQHFLIQILVIRLVFLFIFFFNIPCLILGVFLKLKIYSYFLLIFSYFFQFVAFYYPL